MSVVMDASAILALLNGETGAEKVTSRIAGARISSVNLVEVGSRLLDGGMTPEAVRQAVGLLRLEVVDFTPALAEAAYLLRDSTRAAGLSLGDRACLALAARDNRPALTADRKWSTVTVGCSIELIR